MQTDSQIYMEREKLITIAKIILKKSKVGRLTFNRLQDLV